MGGVAKYTSTDAGTQLKLLTETSDRGDKGLAVNIQDQTTSVLTIPFLQTRTVVTLAVDTVQGSRTLTLTGGHGALVGEILELADTSNNTFMQAEILVVATDLITLDQPITQIFLAAGPTTVVVSSKDMLVDGSSTPQIFSILPLPTQSGDMVRIIVGIEGPSEMDFTTFGSDDSLTNGCVLRLKKSDGTFKNLFNFKSNGDFIQQGFDEAFLRPKQGNATHGLFSRVTWGGQDKHGVVIRLDGALGEELQVVIQDDLTVAGPSTNTKFTLLAQGHELQMLP